MAKLLKTYLFELVLTCLCLVGFVVAAEIELFEALYDASRTYEAFELDEIFSLVLVVGFAAPLFLTRANLRLKSALRKREQAEKEAQRVSRHDPLTGLLNRRHMEESLERLRAAAPLGHVACVLVLDLDRFKQVNDLYGHAAGDHVLLTVADRLREACGPEREIVRLGGDEFAVLTTDRVSSKAASSLARRIIAEISKPIVGEGWRSSVSCSVGIAHAELGVGMHELTKQADQAMYRAKRSGRAGYVHFDKRLGEFFQRQAKMEEDIRAALVADQFEPNFQPYFDLETGRLKGFEILARWTCAARGVVPPMVFVPIAEDMGEIHRISWQVFRKALTLAADWDPSLLLSINLSPKEFCDPKLSEKLRVLLVSTGIAPTRIEVEVTESGVIQDMERAKFTVDSMREMGVRLALDDFGTGFSSLSTLARLPFDKLKIDRSFVTKLNENTDQAKIVTSILALAKSIGLEVTAEGIETAEERHFLLELQCDTGQGFFFDRPLSAADADRLQRGDEPVARSG